MKNERNLFQLGVFVSICLGLLAFNLSCSQYDYSSPLPGVLSVRLHTVIDTTQMNFSPLDNFIIAVAEIRIYRSDGAYIPIYADLKAIARNTSIYNSLDQKASDSTLVLGEAYLPPGDYVGMTMTVSPDTQIVLDGYRNIHVSDQDPGLGIVLKRNFQISQGHTTKAVIRFDLSKGLIKQVDTYNFTPYYSISSIQYE